MMSFARPRRLPRHKIPALWLFLFGGPGECEASAKETFRFAERFIRPGDVAFFSLGIRVYPRTLLEQIAREEGLLDVPASEMLSPTFYISPTLDLEWLSNKLKTFLASHRNFLGSSSLELPFLPMLNRIGYSLGMRPPLWRHARLIRRFLKLAGRDV